MLTGRLPNLDESYCSSLRKLIQELGLEESVVFLGFRDNPADYINLMDVVVHSSIEPEPFGRVNIEAMYLKKPVVSTNIGGPTEIFADGKDGILIEPKNPALLAQRIASLLESPESRARLGENAHRTVMERFTIANTIRNVEKVYDRIMNQ